MAKKKKMKKKKKYIPSPSLTTLDILNLTGEYYDEFIRAEIWGSSVKVRISKSLVEYPRIIAYNN